MRNLVALQQLQTSAQAVHESFGLRLVWGVGRDVVLLWQRLLKLCALRNEEVRAALQLLIHRALELDMQHARRPGRVLAVGERQADLALRVPECLLPSRPRVDVVRAAVVRARRPFAVPRAVPAVRRLRARPVERAPDVERVRIRIRADPEADAHRLGLDRVGELEHELELPIILAFRDGAVRDEVELVDRCDEPARDVEGRVRQAIGGKAREHLGGLDSIFRTQTGVNDDVPPFRLERLPAETKVVQVVAEARDPAVPLGMGSGLQRPAGVVDLVSGILEFVVFSGVKEKPEVILVGLGEQYGNRYTIDLCNGKATSHPVPGKLERWQLKATEWADSPFLPVLIGYLYKGQIGSMIGYGIRRTGPVHCRGKYGCMVAFASNRGVL